MFKVSADGVERPVALVRCLVSWLTLRVGENGACLLVLRPLWCFVMLDWRARYERSGMTGLDDEPRSGRPRED